MGGVANSDPGDPHQVTLHELDELDELDELNELDGTFKRTSMNNCERM